ncbi:homoserine kinase [Microlunatus parietis]|uniref:Homoserine kinase n=1 Tax=Microlunatus parietis TaxID=682979 RepID=A0A7Y9LGM4_9ACTN|nr:homoserine kinase [Microlunatus parietis]NYE75376.1 homoserine kinase [Microlunatus parietis]
MAADLVGRTVTVSAPATSANLGPGFDHLGLAFDLRQAATLRVTETGFTAAVTGEGADTVPRDGSHLILRSAVAALADLGREVPGLALTADNVIPHGRGLGSSAAAIIAGLFAGTVLAGVDPEPERLLGLANELEGHADNVAAALLGGLVIAYPEPDRVGAVSVPVHPELGATVYLPDTSVPTSEARGLLPAEVPHSDAAANAGRAALLVEALSRTPDLLLPATEDRLHQRYRRTAMPESYDLLELLRSKGFAAVVSGAGPSVLVLGRAPSLAGLPEHPGFRRRSLAIGAGARVEPPAAAV